MRPWQQITYSSADIARDLVDTWQGNRDRTAFHATDPQPLFDATDYHDASNSWLAPGIDDSVMSDDQAFDLAHPETVEPVESGPADGGLVEGWSGDGDTGWS